ncbi:TetR family transcriptional regulator C-terminal domain-containing protein [Saccharopolyspora sp. K220]|uniref:TetR/AcrR family transcriptional regulator n=1 Tax=Saccharopolyspora soli TaxID=2926618 RepID=UPI001F5ACC45|nr:TetR family transcriptional regulator C-terminal domain-containing protein [Saccharopolyspora soli]MCI2417388.1 TetR family transcriptional regulator C-terminal domain-containing protein [Saccharopolyspora soli]
MPRVKKEVGARREEILTTTLDLITERGVSGLRGSDVAVRLNVSTALVFYHFESLDNLIMSAFRHATERDLGRLDNLLAEADGSVTERLRTALNEYGPTGAAPSWRLWIEGWSASLRDSELRGVIRTLDSRWRAVVTDLIGQGVAAGEFRTADPRGAAWRLTAMLDGLAVQRVAFDEAVSKTDVANWIATALAAELGLTA